LSYNPGCGNGNSALFDECGNAVQWEFTNDSTIRTQVALTYLCLEASSTTAGSFVFTKSCDPTKKTQLWTLHASNIVSQANTALCLDIFNDNADNCANTDVWPCGADPDGSNSNQHFALQPDGAIITAYNGFCLTIGQ